MNRFYMFRFVGGLLFLLLFDNRCYAGEKSQNTLSGLDPSKKITQFSIDVWNSENGLIYESILDITQAKDGYLWIASFDGLFRFDGVKFDVFNKQTSQDFQVDGVLSVSEPVHGELWIGTNGKGVYRYINGKFSPFDENDYLHDSYVTTFYSRNPDKIWIGTRNGLFLYQNQKLHHYKDHPILGTLRVHELLEDDQGVLWIGSNNHGLVRFDGEEVMQYQFTDLAANLAVRAICFESPGKGWIGLDAGFLEFDNGKYDNFLEVPELQAGFINKIVMDQNRSLWIGTDNGLVRYNHYGFDVFDESKGLGHNTVQSLMEDREGSLWIGTYRGGVTRLKDGKFRNFGSPEGLANDVVNTIFFDGKDHWIGTEGGFAQLKEDEIVNYINPKSKLANRVKSFYKTPEGELWIGTYDGIFTLKKGQLEEVKIQNAKEIFRMRNFLRRKNGDLWIGTTRGVKVIRPNGTILEYGRENGIQNTFIMSMVEDDDQNMWLGTNGSGLYRFDGNSFHQYKMEDGLLGNVIFQITKSKDGTLWIGTNGGLTQFHSSNGFQSFTKESGVLEGAIFQALEDELGYFWLLTGHGVYQVHRQELDAVIEGKKKEVDEIRFFTRTDGMRSGQITGASAGTIGKDGQIFIPTLKGITVIDPGNIAINTYKPPVIIEKILADLQDRSYQTKVELEPGTKRLEIQYTGLSFFAPDKVDFHYKLEGFDKDWIEAGGRRTAYYTNLPPGDYQFKVKASNNDGIWNEEGAQFALVQLPFFYQTKTFFLLVILSAICLGLLIQWGRLLALRKRNIVLTRMVENRTKDIEAQKSAIEKQKEELENLNTVKDKLFSIISHDLRSPLSSIKQLLYLNSISGMKKMDFDAYTHKLENEVNNLLSFLDNILHWARKQMGGFKTTNEAIKPYAIAEEIIRLYQEHANQKNIQLMNQIDPELVLHMDPSDFNLIIRNLISNGIKFTPKEGTIRIASVQSDEEVCIEIQDTGVGMNKEELLHLFNSDKKVTKAGTFNEKGAGFGLFLVKEFIEKNEGSIFVESEIGKGSTFKVKFNSTVYTANAIGS